NARFRADLPGVVHPADAVARVSAAVAEDDLELRTLVHDTAVDQRGERHRAIDEVADRVRQVIAPAPRRHQRLHALVEEDHRAHLLGGLEERPERSEEHTSELQSRSDLVCRLLLEKKKKKKTNNTK